MTHDSERIKKLKARLKGCLISSGKRKRDLKGEVSSLRDKIERLEKECAELRAEVEKLVWNLAGCDTYALGYGDLHEAPSKEWTRPALVSVMNMAIAKKALEAEVASLSEGLGKVVEVLRSIVAIKVDGSPDNVTDSLALTVAQNMAQDCLAILNERVK